MRSRTDNAMREALGDFLGILEYKARNGVMSVEDVRVVIGPTTSAAQFQNTLVHEIHHLAVAVADSLGVDLEGETPAYLAGDSAMSLADIICRLGCDCRRD